MSEISKKEHPPLTPPYRRWRLRGGIEFNSHRFQLSAGLHSNRRLQELWKQYGEDGFEYKVESILEYDNLDEDQTAKLTAMLDCFLLEHPQAVKLAR